MTEPVRIVPRVERRNRQAEADRRAADRRIQATTEPLDVAPDANTSATDPARPAPTVAAPADPAAAFAAQVMGQSGQRRGLKGGPPVLDAARSSYLNAEYAGAAERRPKPGRATDTDI